MNNKKKFRILAHTAIAFLLPLVFAISFYTGPKDNFGVDVLEAFIYLSTGVIGVIFMGIEHNTILFRIATFTIRLIILFGFIYFSMKPLKARTLFVLHGLLSALFFLTGYFILVSVWL